MYHGFPKESNFKFLHFQILFPKSAGGSNQSQQPKYRATREAFPARSNRITLRIKFVCRESLIRERRANMSEESLNFT